MHTRTSTLATRMIRLCRMMALVVVVAMLPTRTASADLPCGDKDAEMPQDLAKVLHKLRKEMEAGNPTYLNKLIVPNVYDSVRDFRVFGLHKLFESISPGRNTRSWSSEFMDCEALEQQWICLSQTEALPATEREHTFVHVGNVAGTLLKEAPREGSATTARLGCRAFLDIGSRSLYSDGTYWRKAEAVDHVGSPRGYVKNDDLVYGMSGAVTFARVGGIWRIAEMRSSAYD